MLAVGYSDQSTFLILSEERDTARREIYFSGVLMCWERHRDRSRWFSCAYEGWDLAPFECVKHTKGRL